MNGLGPWVCLAAGPGREAGAAYGLLSSSDDSEEPVTAASLRLCVSEGVGGGLHFLARGRGAAKGLYRLKDMYGLSACRARRQPD